MSNSYASTRREVSKLGLTAVGAVLAGSRNKSGTSNCDNLEILLEEGDLETNWGTQYVVDVKGAETSVELYSRGEEIDEFEPGSKFILLPGEYKLKTENNGCSYIKELTVEN